MSEDAAVAFLERVESDEDFARELAALREDPPAVLDRIHAAGFDVEPQEVREAYLERYGSELTQEQMDQIAAGVDPTTVVAGVVGVGVLIGVAAIAAGL